MTEVNYWLMNHVPVVIAMDLKNQINSVHTPSTLFAIDSRSKLRGIKPSFFMDRKFIAEKIMTLIISLIG